MFEIFYLDMFIRLNFTDKHVVYNTLLAVLLVDCLKCIVYDEVLLIASRICCLMEKIKLYIKFL